jgi:hypothetical protein
VLGEGFANLFRRHLRLEARQDLAVFAHQELREVPGDVFVAVRGGVPLLEEPVQVTGAFAVDLDLGEDRKLGAELLPGESQDLVVGPGLLGAELVAGKAEDAEALAAMILVKGTQTCVLGSESSLAGEVHYQADLALVVAECDRVARGGRHLEIVHARHGTSICGFAREGTTLSRRAPNSAQRASSLNAPPEAGPVPSRRGSRARSRGLRERSHARQRG